MANISVTGLKKHVGFFKTKWGIAVIVAVILIAGYWYTHRTTITYQFITVKRGSITETVSVTGNTTPIKSVSLGFQNSGIVAHVYHDVGEHVANGDILAALNTNDLSAQLKQAQANYQKILAGASSEEIAVAQTALNTAQANLENIKKVQSTLVDNAHRTLLNVDLTPILTSGTSTTSPIISGTYTGDEGSYVITSYPTGSGEYFSTSGIENANGNISTGVPTPFGTKGLSIVFPANYPSSSNIVWTVLLPNTKSPYYVSAYNAYQNALKNKDSAESAAQAAVAQAQANLNLQNASARPADLGIAEAEVASAQAKLQNSEIIAPISGVITQQDAKIGQVASLGTPLVSIISEGQFEVDAQVPETDIGKVAMGNIVVLSFDAFPGETFKGKVFYIDPAETITQGVVDYKIKVSLDVPDPRMKSGLTANLGIQTKEDTAVLILPQYAILENDQGSFIETLSNNKVLTTPVQLGIQDDNGKVEIKSGVTEGEQVLNIGLKTTAQ